MKTKGGHGMGPIHLGDRAKDRISGFVGIVTGITEWLYGCRRIGLQGEKLKDGKPQETVWVDEGQAILVKPEVVKPFEVAATPVLSTGGPPRGEETR